MAFNVFSNFFSIPFIKILGGGLYGLSSILVGENLFFFFFYFVFSFFPFPLYYYAYELVIFNYID